VPSLADELAKGRAPGFIRPLVIQKTREGLQATFTCLPYGNPFPKIKWLKDGVELTSDNEKFTMVHLEDGTQQLTVKNCTPNDEGYYRCVASNDFGTSSTKADLIVEGLVLNSNVLLVDTMNFSILEFNNVIIRIN